MNSNAARLRHTTSSLLMSVGLTHVAGKVLDVGCRDMPFKRAFPNCEWVGLDTRPVADIIADPHKMEGVEDESFDTVLCLDVLHLCPFPQMVMNECVRVLKPGGRLLVSVPNTYIDDNSSYWRITKLGMEHLAKTTGKLEIGYLNADGRLFSNEWMETFGSMHDDARGWLSSLDSQYPQSTFMIARKSNDS